MPNWKPEIKRRLASLKLEPTREAEIVEELSQHLEDRFAELLACGATQAEAGRAALAELSERELLQRELQRVERQVAPDPIVLGTNRRKNMIADLWQDLCYGTRMLTKQPGFTLIAVLTLALGIGANTAIFSVVNAVLLRPLPYPEPERLMMVWESSPKDEQLQVGVAVRDFLDWREQNTVFEDLAATSPISFNLSEGGEPEYLEGRIVSASFLPMLGVKPFAGRAFLTTEDQSGQGRVVMLSYGLWQRRFGGDPNIIGRTLALSGDSYTVVGILPGQFRFPGRADFLIPLGFYSGDALVYRGMHQLTVMGRLKPGVILAQAQTEMNRTARSVWKESPLFVDWGVTVVPLSRQLYGDVRQVLLVLWAAVGLVLLIACANIANLLLARSAGRQREMAIRAALGAARWRLMRQLLTESLLLTLLGGVAGVALAVWSGGVVRQMMPASLPQLNDVALDRVVFGYTLLVALLTGLLFGVGPALGGARAELNQVLKEGGRSAMVGKSRLRWRHGLVVGEVALSLLLLVGAALLVKSFWKLQQVDAGLRVDHTLAFRLTLPLSQYPQPHSRASFFRQLREQVEHLPGVQAAGLGSSIPFSQLGVNAYTSVFIEGRPSDDFRQVPNAGLRVVDEGYFKTLGTRLVRGRMFMATDVQDAPWVAVINETMARRFWPDSDPIGVRIRDGSSPDMNRWATIVGIVADVKNRGLQEATAQEIYVPYQQRPARSMTVVLHTASDPLALLPAIRQQVAMLDPAQPIYAITTMEQLVGDSLAVPNLSMFLLGGLAGLALLLAAVGLYGVISYSVSQRLPEIGIRVALGAQRRDIFKLVMGQGLALTLIGVAAGLLAALALTRFLVTLLFGVSPIDPITFGVITLGLIAVALLACYLPARRATKVDPLVVLRCE